MWLKSLMLKCIVASSMSSLDGNEQYWDLNICRNRLIDVVSVWIYVKIVPEKYALWKISLFASTCESKTSEPIHLFKARVWRRPTLALKVKMLEFFESSVTFARRKMQHLKMNKRLWAFFFFPAWKKLSLPVDGDNVQTNTDAVFASAGENKWRGIDWLLLASEAPPSSCRLLQSGPGLHRGDAELTWHQTCRLPFPEKFCSPLKGLLPPAQSDSISPSEQKPHVGSCARGGGIKEPVLFLLTSLALFYR